MKKLSRNSFARPALRMKNGAGAAALAIDNIAYRYTGFLYDSFTVAQAAAFPQLTPMFTVPSSGAKTKSQTNMEAQGMLANNELFDLSRIRFIPSFNVYPADALNLLQNVRASLMVKGREFLYGPILAFPGGAGGNLTAAAAATTAAATTIQITGFTNGHPDLANAFGFDDPIRIENNDGFKVEVVADVAFNMTAQGSGGTGVTLYCFLDGTRLRKVA